jgi:acetyl-CoA C-acetyltransferase
VRESVIVAGARTPFGKFGGVLKELKAVELGAVAIRGALFRAEERMSKGADAAPAASSALQINGVIMGMVLQAGAGQNPTRQAARLAGLDWDVAAETINKVCASGMRAITMADQIIRAGDADTLIAGGMESMSNALIALSPQARWGLRSGDSNLMDLMIRDGLQCAFDDVHMAIHGNQAAVEYGISREEQDKWALRSHLRAVEAIRAGKFSAEIAAVTAVAAGRDGVHQLCITDESPRADSDAASLARLSPIFDKNGTITAGNAPGVNDGAAALLVMSKEKAEQAGYKPMAKIIAHATVGSEAPYIAATPALAIRRLLQRTGLTLEDITLFEVNEAFAAVVLTSGHLLGWEEEKVNVNGGAIALGHPIGASGARIVLTLIGELQRRGGGLGIAAICSGGAQGDAILIQVDG